MDVRDHNIKEVPAAESVPAIASAAASASASWECRIYRNGFWEQTRPKMECKNCLTIWGENVWCKLTQLTPLPLKPTAKQLIVPARLVLPWSNWKVDSQIWILLNILLPAWWLHSREKQVSISQLTSGLQSIYISMLQVKGIAMIRCLAALRSKLCVLGQVCWEK